MRNIVIHGEHIFEIALIWKDMDHPTEDHRNKLSTLRIARLRVDRPKHPELRMIPEVPFTLSAGAPEKLVGFDRDDVALAERAAAQGLWLWPLSRSYIPKDIRKPFILGYGNVAPQTMPKAVAKLKSLLSRP